MQDTQKEKQEKEEKKEKKQVVLSSKNITVAEMKTIISKARAFNEGRGKAADEKVKNAYLASLCPNPEDLIKLLAVYEELFPGDEEGIEDLKEALEKEYKKKAKFMGVFLFMIADSLKSIYKKAFKNYVRAMSKENKLAQKEAEKLAREESEGWSDPLNPKRRGRSARGGMTASEFSKKEAEYEHRIAELERDALDRKNGRSARDENGKFFRRGERGSLFDENGRPVRTSGRDDARGPHRDDFHDGKFIRGLDGRRPFDGRRGELGDDGRVPPSGRRRGEPGDDGHFPPSGRRRGEPGDDGHFPPSGRRRGEPGDDGGFPPPGKGLGDKKSRIPIYAEKLADYADAVQRTAIGEDALALADVRVTERGVRTSKGVSENGMKIVPDGVGLTTAIGRTGGPQNAGDVHQGGDVAAPFTENFKRAMQSGNKTSTGLSTGVDTYAQTTADINATGFREVDNQGGSKIAGKTTVHLTPYTEGAGPRLGGKSHVIAVAAGQTGYDKGVSHIDNAMDGEEKIGIGHYTREEHLREFREVMAENGGASQKVEPVTTSVREVDVAEVVFGVPFTEPEPQATSKEKPVTTSKKKKTTIPVRGFGEMTDEQMRFMEKILIDNQHMAGMPEKW